MTKDNKIALEKAKRSEESIVYDSKYPLIIDEKTKIRKIKRLKGNDIREIFEDGEVIEEEVEVPTETVRLYFKNNRRNENYVVDIDTNADLEEVEECLLQCTCERDIYVIKESLSM